MTEAQKILQMIKAADPADTATMDEIDARVWCWIKNKKYSGTVKDVHYYFDDLDERFHYRCGEDTTAWPEVPRYSKSRDALKAIRPEGWLLLIAQFSTGFNCDLQKQGDMWIEPSPSGRGLPTECLAELHAIIQSIEYERTAK